MLTPKTPAWQDVRSLTLSQLADLPLILHTANTGMRKIVLDLFAGSRIEAEDRGRSDGRKHDRFVDRDGAGRCGRFLCRRRWSRRR